MEQNKKINHLIVLRVTAIILVVFAHATRDINLANTHMYSPLNTPWWEISIKQYIYSFHMPLFFWISGFTFYFSTIEKSSNISLYTKILKKCQRLALPMYATSFFILLPTIFLLGHLNGSLLIQIKHFILGANNDHLWFLKTLFIIFIFTIPIYHFRKDNKFFYFSILFSWSLIFYLKSFMPSILLNPINYFPFFMMGVLSRKHEVNLTTYKRTMLFAILLLLHFILFQYQKNLPDQVKDWAYYIIAFIGIYFMYFYSKIISTCLKSKTAWILLNKIDSASFSIYLFHVTFLYLILFLNFKFQINIPIIRIICAVISGLIGSYAIHIVFRKNIITSFLFGIRK